MVSTAYPPSKSPSSLELLSPSEVMTGEPTASQEVHVREYSVSRTTTAITLVHPFPAGETVHRRRRAPGLTSNTSNTAHSSPTPVDPAAGRRAAVSKVLKSLDLESAQSGSAGESSFSSGARFSAWTEGQPPMYGGISLALAYEAAARSVDANRRLHAFHGTFLRAGRPEKRLDLTTTTVRDGRSFSERRCAIHQAGSLIFEANCSFRKPPATGENPGLVDSLGRRGINHDPRSPPLVPDPEQCVDREKLRQVRLGPAWLEHPVNAVEVRLTDERLLEPGFRSAPRVSNWVRVPACAGLPERTRIALLLYASDRALLSTAALPHGIVWTRALGVSLHHTFWLHRVPQPADWHLFDSESYVAVDGLAMIRLFIFNREGLLVASAVQEALVQASIPNIIT